MTLTYIDKNSKNDNECHQFFRKYLYLPETVIGAYGGYQNNETFLSFPEEVLQIRIFILKIGSLSEGDDPAVMTNKNVGRLYHINENEDSEFESSYYEKILFPSENSLTFYPLCVVFLVKNINHFDILMPRQTSGKAMTVKEILNIALSFLQLLPSQVEKLNKNNLHLQSCSEKTRTF